MTNFLRNYISTFFSPIVMNIGTVYDGVTASLTRTTYFVDELWREVERLKDTPSEEIAHLCYVYEMWKQFKVYTIWPFAIIELEENTYESDRLRDYINSYVDFFKHFEKWLNDGNRLCDMDSNTGGNNDDNMSIQDKWRNDLRNKF